MDCPNCGKKMERKSTTQHDYIGLGKYAYVNYKYWSCSKCKYTTDEEMS